MYVPTWLLVLAGVVVTLVLGWTVQVARGMNPLPFPDGGSRIFSAASPAAKDAVVALLSQHGIQERFRFDSKGVLRSILWDGTIINCPSPEVSEKLGHPTSSIGLVAADPTVSAERAAEFLRSRGFDARVVLDAEPELPIAFVVSNVMPGSVINFRKHVIHLPKPTRPGSSD